MKTEGIETYIRVASMRAFPSYLVWLDGIGVTVDADWLDIDESKLEKELRKVGGGITLSGLYPSPAWLETILRTDENMKRAADMAAKKRGK